MAKKKRKDEERKKIFVILIGIFSVLVALIGATFAYFTATVNNVNGNDSVTITTSVIKSLEYRANKSLVLEDVQPGVSDTGTFTIKNPNETAVARYGLVFIPDYNDFVNTAGNGQLLITISGGALTSPVVYDYTNGNTDQKQIVKDVRLNAGQTHTYTAKVEFVELNIDQNSNGNKSFAAHIDITDGLIITDQAN